MDVKIDYCEISHMHVRATCPGCGSKFSVDCGHMGRDEDLTLDCDKCGWHGRWRIEVKAVLEESIKKPTGHVA
ncbi:hypothetical protein LCGC14_0163610 [marine sediment metagenome]|uniref:Uncharacterized protein n=1 Tax=marine sediment metagenome TaxID=412755 RepID=A0A0F9VAB5_9ZZZZ